MRMLHFVNNEIVTDLWGHPQPKLYKIWPFFSRLVEQYRAAYIPERDILIDESLMLFNARLGWVKFHSAQESPVWNQIFLPLRGSVGIRVELVDLHRKRH